MASIITADNGVSSGSAGLKSSADSSGVLALASGTGTTAVTIDASQNVGIGTSSPTSILSLKATSPQLDFITAAASDTSASIQGSVDTGTGGKLVFITKRNGNTAIEQARIDSSGNLLVGTTSASNSNSNSGYFLPAFGAWVLQHANGTGSGVGYVQFNYNGTQIGGISQNGTTAVAYNTTSDYRLKENVQPLENALDRIAALKPCTYTWKSAPDEIGEGFIAHELQEVCPQAVTGEKDAVETYVDEDGIEQTKPKYQSIDTSFLVATLTAAIQEQQALITTLTERITALEAK